MCSCSQVCSEVCINVCSNVCKCSELCRDQEPPHDDLGQGERRWPSPHLSTEIVR